jgi:hypothetical protein
MRGRAALAASIDDFFADPLGLSARLVSTIDVQGQIFRFRAVVEDRDGRLVFGGFDADEVDVDGRITVLLTFGGALPIPLPCPRRFDLRAIATRQDEPRAKDQLPARPGARWPNGSLRAAIPLRFRAA